MALWVNGKQQHWKETNQQNGGINKQERTQTEGWMAASRGAERNSNTWRRTWWEKSPGDAWQTDKKITTADLCYVLYSSLVSCHPLLPLLGCLSDTTFSLCVSSDSFILFSVKFGWSLVVFGWSTSKEIITRHSFFLLPPSGLKTQVVLTFIPRKPDAGNADCHFGRCDKPSRPSHSPWWEDAWRLRVPQPNQLLRCPTNEESGNFTTWKNTLMDYISLFSLTVLIPVGCSAEIPHW